MKFKKVTITAIAFTSIAFAVFAHGGAKGIVKERMDGMSAMGKVVKQLSAMMRSEIPYNAQTVHNGAKKIEGHSGETMTKLFPKGTDGMPSYAAPKIWDEWDKFSALSGRLQVLSQGLAAAAPNGLGTVSTQPQASMMRGNSATMMGGNSGSMMGASTPAADMNVSQMAGMPADAVFNMVTQSCAACHTQFRLEK